MITEEQIIKAAKECGFGTQITVKPNNTHAIEIWGGRLETVKVTKLANHFYRKG